MLLFKFLIESFFNPLSRRAGIFELDFVPLYPQEQQDVAQMQVNYY